MLGNLIEKVITNRQVHFITIYFIAMKWVKDLYTNTLVFDIVQFFPSLNH